ncbi:hAT family dimerization domain protein [Purpureocillium lavendulum]|uniref:HAT family dimerization domain protein n=1 Tax=Purpureocillium lavendulum TaxID=1247861 RepID=A0AB34FDB0_9HYPO|nr:hAT family dimerization domain protein [Purpureocillium lavendulum]
MEGLGIAANVIAVVDLSVKVADCCVEYCKSVKNAKDNIVRFRLEVDGLQRAANSVKELLGGPSGERLKASQQLSNSVRHSESELQAVYERLRPTSAREIFARVGLRTLRWPFQGKEVEKIMQNIARCTQAINLALQVDQTNIIFDLDRRTVLARLESEVAKGASFDSRAEEHHATCLQGTRVDLLHQLSLWALDSGAVAVFWLNGMAGTGKSTIARTVARNLAHNQRLGASFFFKRGETDRASMSKFSPTLAVDLANNIPTIAPHVKDAMETCPGILRKAAHEQFDKLVWQPLSIIASDPSSPIPVVVLDALDECENEKDIELMFRLLSRAAKAQPARVKVFLTSRPELPIRLGFRDIEGEYQYFRLHEIFQHVITHDINTFFHEELRRIRRDYNSTVRQERQLPEDWPGASELMALVHMAIPLFIFAATVCRFIGDRRLGSPDRQLAKVLFRAEGEGSQLAATYLPVLENMIDGTSVQQREESVQAFRVIVGSIVVLASPLPVLPLARILDISEQDIEDKLDVLHSVLSVPETAEAPVRPLHLSFRDFLVDPSQRADHPFWVDEKETHQGMAAHCLRVLKSLRQDICDVKALGTLQSAIDQHTIEASVPPEVHDKATSVAFSHDSALVASSSWDNTIRVWRTATGECIWTLEGHDDWVESVSFSHDSALVASGSHDKTIRVWRTATSECIWVLEGHSNTVRSVAFSHDSALVASGSHDKTIRVWRTATGDCVWVLESHSDRVTSVAFSHDSALVASGSDDKTIRVWRTATGDCIWTLESHSNTVTSVAFSHDSALVASASDDKTIRVWRTATGECIWTLEGHNSSVTSVTFSHDSTLVASGSVDNTIRVWRTATGECIWTLEGHNSFVTSVAFSHDSALVASGSWDNTIEVWRMATGESIRTLWGHNSLVMSVAFSHDSALVASGYSDNTIRVWRMATGECVQTLEAHDGLVTSVAFSHDSALVASSSVDNTIRLWRTATGECIQKSHTLILDFVDWPSLWDDLDYDSYEEDDRGIGVQNFFVNGMLGFSIPLVWSMARVINFDSLKSLTLRMYPGWDDFLTRVVQLKLPIKLKTLEIQGPDEGEGIEEPILRFLNAFQGLNELFLNQIAPVHTLHIWSCIARRHATLRRFVQHQRTRDRSGLFSDEHDQPDLALWGLELFHIAENPSHNPIASFDLEFLGLSCVPELLPSEATRKSPVSSHGTPSGDHRDQPPQTSPSQRTSTPDHATAERSAPPAETPKSVMTWSPPKALPNPRHHTTDQLNQMGDEYLPREVDKFGEKKVMANGQLLGGRRYRCRTFLVANRGDKLFMLATECAKKLGYRDSYLLFNKNRSLYKIVASQVEKDDLVQREILPFSYRSRHITIVTARSMFRQFGSRVIADGRRVRDDYWETLARKQGFTKADPAGEKRRGSKSRATAESRNKYLPSYPGTEVALSTATEMPSLPDAPRSKLAGTTAAPPKNTAVTPGWAVASTYSSGAFSREWSSTANGTSSRQIIGPPYHNPAMDMISTAHESRVLPPDLVGPAGAGDRIATAGRPHISAYTTASAAATQPLVTPPHPPQALRENPYPQSLQSHYYTNQPMWSQTLGHSTGTYATQYESVHRAQSPAFHLQQPRAGQDEPIMSFGRQYGSSYGMYLVNQTPGGHAPHTGPD